jgi:hypothetical protein
LTPNEHIQEAEFLLDNTNLQRWDGYTLACYERAQLHLQLAELKYMRNSSNGNFWGRDSTLINKESICDFCGHLRMAHTNLEGICLSSAILGAMCSCTHFIEPVGE